jgi:uncharacterized protein YbjQ (UPF0145 family)
MKSGVITMCAVLIAGCAHQLTQGGQRVRLVDRQSDRQCEFIGTVTGANALGNTKAHDSQGAMNQMRNYAAEMGANAVRVLNVDVTYGETNVIGEALRCKF